MPHLSSEQDPINVCGRKDGQESRHHHGWMNKLQTWHLTQQVLLQRGWEWTLLHERASFLKLYCICLLSYGCLFSSEYGKEQCPYPDISL